MVVHKSFVYCDEKWSIEKDLRGAFTSELSILKNN